MQKIVFKNEPKLSEHAIHKDFNERRIKLIPLIEGYISHDKHFKDKEVNITFSHEGVGLLVSIIETVDDKCVLKVPLSLTFAESEGLFIRTWENMGVKVPHIIEEGMLGPHSYLLYEYVDAPSLRDKYSHEDLINKGIYLEMGKVLRLMHEPEGHGYGRADHGRGEHETFAEGIHGAEVLKALDYIRSEKLLDEEQHGSVETAFEILENFVSKNTKSSYCHFDFGASNIFATDPITVFDPNPQFNHGYMDVGRTIVNSLAYGIFPEQFVQGYFGNQGYDKKVLHAWVFLNVCLKLPSQHKKNKTDIVSNIRKYLSANKNLLES